MLQHSMTPSNVIADANVLPHTASDALPGHAMCNLPPVDRGAIALMSRSSATADSTVESLLLSLEEVESTVESLLPPLASSVTGASS